VVRGLGALRGDAGYSVALEAVPLLLVRAGQGP